MFAWTRTFYAKKTGVYYNFDMKRQRDDAVKNHGMVKVPAVEAYKHFKGMVQVPWRMYRKIIEEVDRGAYTKNQRWRV